MSETLQICGMPFGATQDQLANMSELRRLSWLARPNSTTPDTVGTPLTVVSNGGSTLTARNVANTNQLSMTKKAGIVTTASAGTLAEVYSGVTQFNGTQGYIFQTILAISDAATVAGAITGVGMFGTASALTNADITTLTNYIAFTQTSADGANWHFSYNGAGTAIDVSLGPDFPINNTNLYQFGIIQEPGSGIVRASAYNITQDKWFISQPITTGIPTASTLLAPHVFRSNNATAAVAGLDVAMVNVLSFL